MIYLKKCAIFRNFENYYFCKIQKIVKFFHFPALEWQIKEDWPTFWAVEKIKGMLACWLWLSCINVRKVRSKRDYAFFKLWSDSGIHTCRAKTSCNAHF